MSSPTARRRQRSTRVVVASSLLTCAAVLVTVAFLDNVAWLQAFAAVSSVVLGAAATRITHAELMASRVEAARERAAQAQAYATLDAARSAETLAFTTTMTTRVERQDQALSELESALGEAQKRAASATRRFNAEARRAEQAEREGHAVACRLEDAEERATSAARRLEDAEQAAATAAGRVTELEAEVAVLRARLAA